MKHFIHNLQPYSRADGLYPINYINMWMLIFLETPSGGPIISHNDNAYYILHNDAPNGIYLDFFVHDSICFQHYRTSVSYLLYIHTLFIQVKSTSNASLVIFYICMKHSNHYLQFLFMRRQTTPHK